MNQSGNQQPSSLNLPQSVNPQLLSVHPPPIVSLNHPNTLISMSKTPSTSTEQHINQPSKFQISHSYSNWRPRIQNFPNSFVLLPSCNWRDQKKAATGVVLNSPAYGRSRRSSRGYKTKTLHKSHSQNAFKTNSNNQRRKFHKKYVPLAPRNTSSFIIRAKKSGGIAPLVSPYPVTPAVLPTPIFSPSKELLVDMAKEEWGVDGYGSMKGLIRLRYPGHEADGFEEEQDDDDEEGEGDGVCSSESDVEEHVEVERRLDQDLSRFEMVYPNYEGVEYDHVSENIIMDDDHNNRHMEQLEVENMRLKEQLVLMTKDLTSLTKRLRFLEGQSLTFVDNCSDSDGCHGQDDLQAVV